MCLRNEGLWESEVVRFFWLEQIEMLEDELVSCQKQGPVCVFLYSLE